MHYRRLLRYFPSPFEGDCRESQAIALILFMYSTPVFFVDNIPVHGDVILAPMDGICDEPTRLLYRRMGSAVTYSEFINVIDVAGKLKDFSKRVTFSPEERPMGFQLYGSQPLQFLAAAQLLLPLQPDFFDINLGCSVRCVAGRGAGAGLLTQPQIITEIMQVMKKEISLPITAKMRIGWDHDNLNYLEIAQILEANGAAALAVHGRTRRQNWNEPSDWAPIREVKQTISIPVIGNGDVKTVSDIDRMITETGCDAVMIGRGALGNPWLMARIEKSDLSQQEILSVIREHWESMVTFYGAEKASFNFRKHLKAYLNCPQFSSIDYRPIFSSLDPQKALGELIK
jgi:tRNA-dihydrouridine synthase B